jgi:predicted small lipoprotein YifL
MADNSSRRIALLCVVLAMLAGCGKKGPLYLPEAASEVVTRPAETPPAAESTTAPNSPQTPDSQPAAPAPAPEVSAPEETKEQSQDAPKKEKGASPPTPPKN